MVRVQDEDAVQSALQHGVHDVLFARHAKHHAQEVARVRQIVLGVLEGLTHAVFVCHGHQSWHFGNQANGRNFTVLWIVNVGAVVIEGRQSAHQTSQHSHRVSITAEAAQEKLHLLIHHGVVVYQFVKVSALFAIGQFAF